MRARNLAVIAGWFCAFWFCMSLAPFVRAQPQPRPAATPSGSPRLIVAIVIDQFRYDYLTRFRSEYTGGLKRLLEDGANFTNANYRHHQTVTATGHSTFLTGSTPAMTGIIGNEWWDRATSAVVTSVSDGGTRLLGGDGPGSSPRRLLQSTLGDELKASGKGGKVIGVSMKDRSAILPAGHTADAAYWFDSNTGNFVSSTYYFNALPAWVTEINRSRPGVKYAGQAWLKHKLPDSGPPLFTELEATPFSNELIQQFALRALGAEKLGGGPHTDILAVSYSGNDYVGHRYGPDSEEVHDTALRVDKLVGALLQAAEAQAGAGNVLAVLTADHGVAPLPEENRKRKMPGGRLDSAPLKAAIEAALHEKFGGSQWIAYAGESSVYLNLQPHLQPRVDPAEAERVAANVLRAWPHVARVYTHTQMAKGEVPGDAIGISLRNGFSPVRSGSVVFLLDPYWIFLVSGATHGTPYGYDTHVPMLFLGARIKPGRYHSSVAPNDIAPTLAAILEIETPSGSVGRVLTEMLK